MAPGGGDQRVLRAAAVCRLVELAAAGPLSRKQVAVVARGLAVSDQTVWRWVARALSWVEPATRPRLFLDA